MVDVAIDQSGCVETSLATTYPNSTHELEGIVHYCVPNLPKAVGHTATEALCNATLHPYTMHLATLGTACGLEADAGLAAGLAVADGCRGIPDSRKSAGWSHEAKYPRDGWMGHIIDVTMKVSPDMPVWHVDAPCHFLPAAEGVDELVLDRVIGRCEVIDVNDDAGLVTSECLESAWPNFDRFDRLLLRTRNSRDFGSHRAFNIAFIALALSAAELLQARGVMTIGVDYLSVARYVDDKAEPDYGYPVHHALLGAGIMIIEGLDLSHAATGTYELYCLPLPLVGSEAAPARAILVTISEDRRANGTVKQC